jgi:hypothetical protein
VLTSMTTAAVSSLGRCGLVSFSSTAGSSDAGTVGLVIVEWRLQTL